MAILLVSVLVLAVLLAALALFLVVAERFLLDYGICRITVNDGERVLDVDGGQNLMEALNSQEIYIPSACGGQGTCGYCKVTVRAGGGHVLPTELPLLDRRQIRAGLRLACQVKVREPMAVAVPEDILSVRLFAAVLESTRNVTYDTKELRLRLLEPPEIRHRPGQYVQVRAPAPDGPVWRAYSISSPVSVRGEVGLVVRLVPGGIGSTYLHNLAPGQRLTFTGPFGEFRLSEDPATEIVCVAGGCGLAPVTSIVETLYERWPERPAWLFFGARTGRDVFYLDRFQRLAAAHPRLRVVYALSEPGADDAAWAGETGFIHLAVDKYLEPGVRRQAFLCGPEPMIVAVTRVLQEKGVAPADVYYDKF